MNRQTIIRKTPREAAQFVIRLCGANACPDRTAAQYLANAATSRKEAIRAAAAKSGRASGYTSAEHLAAAIESESRAISVPAAMRELLA